ncbi:MAG: diguanylate cyclase, partial [Thermoanaerobaculia bacterium]|nr:diguanylate cyclase [Thermoanaerobaculia bacterium]
VRDFLGFVETLGRTASEICVPVWNRGQVVAVLNAESVQPARFSDQLLLFEAVAEQISGAVARGLLYEEVRARTDVLETLAEVSRRVVDSKGLQPRLQGLVEYLRKRFDLIVAAIVVSDDAGEFWQERAISMTPAIPIHRSRWPIDAGIVGRAVSRGQTEAVPDVTVDPEYIAINDRVRCELVVPLKIGGRVLGALNMESEDPGLLSAASVRTFEAIGHQVAGAIELAVSHRRLSRSQRELAKANQELSEVNRVLSQLTLVDDLTNIANRRRLSQSLEDEIRRGQRHQEPVTLALFDVDCFKAYNDAYGHLAGDECLRRVATCLASYASRAGELVARYGGEEFAFVMPRVEARDVFDFVDRVRRAVSQLKIEHPDSEVAEVLTLSAGVASVLPEAHSSVDALLAKADDALYQAKRTGRNRTVCFEDLAETPDD